MLRLRPHHFMCVVGFSGKGYSRDFIANMRTIADRLHDPQNNADIEIEIANGFDDICAHCPHKLETECRHETSVKKLDQEYLDLLRLRTGQILTWKEAKTHISHITSEEQKQVCASCSWHVFGVCTEKFHKLRKSVQSLALCLTAVAILLNPAYAAKEMPTSLAATEVIIELARFQKSPKAKKLKKAHTAMQKGKWAECKRLADTLVKDEIFADQALYLSASCLRAEAAQLLETRRFQPAASAAKKAIPLLIQIEVDHPYSPHIKRIPEEIAQTDLLIADALAAKKQWKDAGRAYERAFHRFFANGNGTSFLRVETLTKYAQSCKNSQAMLCNSWLQRLALTYPRNSEEFKALALNATELTDRAQPVRTGNKTSAPSKAPDLDQVAFDSAMQLYLENNYSAALKGFTRFLDEFPRSPHRQRAQYWLAQTFAQDKEQEQAQKLYTEIIKESPFSYYGLLATIASGKTIDTLPAQTIPTVTTTDPYLHPHEVLRIKRAERFIVEDLDVLAAQDLKDIRTRDIVSNDFLMYLAILNNKAGNHGMTFSLIGELSRREYPGILSNFTLDLLFPNQHYELIKKQAAAQKLDPILVISLMKQESAFDADAISVAGATGLMQLMPTTAIDTEATVKRVDLVEAETNIRVGTKYLKKVLNRFNGNIAFALAGYNAGPNAVDRWVREGRAKKGLLEFIESIPYKETREYVGSIIRNYLWYSQKLNGNTPKTLGYFWNIYGPPELQPQQTETINENI